MVVCTLIDNEYASLICSQTFVLTVSAYNKYTKFDLSIIAKELKDCH